ncbi:MAG: hypothetical protein PVG39_00870 [Desulfobacteraceae bacterium]|jgi:hypothetical protein
MGSSSTASALNLATGTLVGNLYDALTDDDEEAATSSTSSAATIEIPDIEIPAISLPDYEAIYQKQQEEAERRMGIEELNSLYSLKYDSADKAVQDVNAQIAEEASHAATRGLDYSVSEAEKMNRINNLFASYWSADQESSLQKLITTWGEQGQVWDSGIMRGEGTASSGAAPTAEKPAGQTVSSRRSGTTVLTDEKEALGGKTVLGG